MWLDTFGSLPLLAIAGMVRDTHNCLHDNSDIYHANLNCHKS